MKRSYHHHVNGGHGGSIDHPQQKNDPTSFRLLFSMINSKNRSSYTDHRHFLSRPDRHSFFNTHLPIHSIIHHNHHRQGGNKPHLDSSFVTKVTDSSRFQTTMTCNSNTSCPLPNRRGGKKVGQLAEENNSLGRQKEIDYLNAEMKAVVKSFFPKQYDTYIQRMMFTLGDYHRPLAEFNLTSYDIASGTHPVKDNYLMRFEMTSPNFPEQTECHPIVYELEQQLNTKGGKFSFASVSQDPVCEQIEQQQGTRTITLSVNDILTSLPDMWFNSPAIDAYLNYIKALASEPEAWYVVSAEDSPERRDRLKEIQKTPKCYKYVLSPLYREHHWTVMCIDHTTRTIYYLNSDVVDKQTPSIQTKPFKDAFPGYKLIIIPCLKQCDNSSCGAYVCYWSYAFLFLPREALLHISCPDILRFRTLIRRQLLLSYYICPLFGVKALP